MTTQLATTGKTSPLSVMAGRFNIEPQKLLDVLKATVIKPTEKHTPSNEEVAAFVMVANQYGLNPFTRQIHAFVGRGGDVVPVVGIDGWVQLVNGNKDFDGCTFETIETADGKLQAVKCVMHAKNRSHPVEVTEWLAECYRDTQPWKGMPRRMLRHKAYIQAARICFGLAGIYDEDEARDIVGVPAAVEIVQPVAPANGVNGGHSAATQAVLAKLAPPQALTSPTPVADEVASAMADELDDRQYACERAIEEAADHRQLHDAGAMLMELEQDGAPRHAELLAKYQARYKAMKQPAPAGA